MVTARMRHQQAGGLRGANVGDGKSGISVGEAAARAGLDGPWQLGDVVNAVRAEVEDSNAAGGGACGRDDGLAVDHAGPEAEGNPACVGRRLDGHGCLRICTAGRRGCSSLAGKS